MNKKINKFILSLLLIALFVNTSIAANEPTAFTVTPIYSTQATATWIPDTSYYYIQILKDNVIVSNQTIANLSTYTWTGLTSKTQYNLSIKSANNSYFNASTVYSNQVYSVITTSSIDFLTLVSLVDALMSVFTTFNSNGSTLVGFIVLIGQLTLVGVIVGFIIVLLNKVKGKIGD